MKTAKNQQARFIAIGLAGFILAVAAVGGGVAYFMNARRAAVQRQDSQTQQAAVAAIVDAMNRSDAEGVLRYVDAEAVFNNLLRHVTEAETKKPLTDDEFKSLTVKNALFVPKMREAIVHGVITQADKDAATGGSVLAALVHLSEGTIAQVDAEHFAVVFADGSSLKFERRESGWVAVDYAGFDAKLAEYRQAVNKGIRDAMGPKADAPTAGKDEGTAGTEAGN